MGTRTKRTSGEKLGGRRPQWHRHQAASPPARCPRRRTQPSTRAPPLGRAQPPRRRGSPYRRPAMPDGHPPRSPVARHGHTHREPIRPPAGCHRGTRDRGRIKQPILGGHRREPECREVLRVRAHHLPRAEPPTSTMDLDDCGGVIDVLGGLEHIDVKRTATDRADDYVLANHRAGGNPRDSCSENDYLRCLRMPLRRATSCSRR